MTTRPTPWTAHRVHGAYQIEDATGDYVAVVPVIGPDDPDAKDDAELIARGVTALAPCIAALNLALVQLKQLPRTFEVYAAIDACENALRTAQGEKE